MADEWVDQEFLLELQAAEEAEEDFDCWPEQEEEEEDEPFDFSCPYLQEELEVADVRIDMRIDLYVTFEKWEGRFPSDAFATVLDKGYIAHYERQDGKENPGGLLGAYQIGDGFGTEEQGDSWISCMGSKGAFHRSKPFARERGDVAAIAPAFLAAHPMYMMPWSRYQCVLLTMLHRLGTPLHLMALWMGRDELGIKFELENLLLSPIY